MPLKPCERLRPIVLATETTGPIFERSQEQADRFRNLVLSRHTHDTKSELAKKRRRYGIPEPVDQLPVPGKFTSRHVPYAGEMLKLLQTKEGE